MKFYSVQEAQQAWDSDRTRLEAAGAYFPEARGYVVESFRHDYTLAMDAQPIAVTSPNSSIPAMLTTLIDPDVFEVAFAPTNAANIFGERRKGTWVDDTAIFPVVEQTGEVSTYGDYNNNGSVGINTNWPQRQAYLYQTILQYGDREIERMGLARINWVAEQDKAAAAVLNRFSNLTYFFGVVGLQNYGLLNDPNLSAALTPAVKYAGGVKWINNGGIVATANEVYADIQAMFYQLVAQTSGLIDAQTAMKLAMSPTSQVALTATNSFGISVVDLMKKNFPNLSVDTAVQYGAQSPANPNGVAAGNLVQLIASQVAGQDTGYCAFNEKMRASPVLRQKSSWEKKITGGTWGAIVRMPAAISQMVGV